MNRLFHPGLCLPETSERCVYATYIILRNLTLAGLQELEVESSCSKDEMRVLLDRVMTGQPPQDPGHSVAADAS